ncbi:MAG: rhodanese-like domain-containing protein [Rhodobacteraceae bacterium]|jgi:rhodanese-related sulfurtransferase|nr:rhodanese-like domain-containing protein [Paracoccaceae bacterium]
MAAAQNVRLTEEMAEAQVTIAGQDLLITRNQDETAVLTGDFTKTSRACPPFCLQPMAPVSGVGVLGELEVISFLQDRVAAGQGALIDARLPEWYAKGSIPGAVNLPFATLASDNPYRNDILLALGAQPLGGDTFDFSAALELTVFCNGAWSDQAMRALRALRAAGYPPEKLHYYRGGMQDWQMLGLTVAATAPAIAPAAEATLAAGEQP